MKASVFASAVLCGLVALPAAAFAQDQVWLKDRRYAEGPGYRVGDFELHPGAALEFGYDSNYLRRSGDVDGEPVLGSLRLMITPSLSFSTLSAQRRETAQAAPPSVEFRGGLSATYNEFIPVMGSAADKSLISQERNVSANADLAAVIFPGRQWSGNIAAGYTRALTPGENGQSLGSFNSGDTFNRDSIRGGADIGWSPGAGLFEWRLGYEFTGNVFESLTELTNLQNEIRTRGRWRFLPRTSLVFDGRFDFINYTSPASASSMVLGGPKTASHPMRALLGVNGLVTQSFAVLVMVGWGASFYTTPAGAVPENFDSVIGQAELKWYITPNPTGDAAATSATLSSVSVGFTRDFYDSWIGTYFERDRGYAQLSYFYGGRFLLVVDGGGAALRYPPLVSASGPGSAFTDARLDATLFGEWRFKDAFGLNATVRYNEEISNTLLNVSGGNTDTLSFREIEAYLGFRWLM